MPDDLHFYFDPVCPFAWLTSKWVRTVAEQRDYRVDWRFISLRIVNADVDYASHFPAYYEEGHTAGLRLLRVAARVRAEHGRDAVGSLYSRSASVCSTPRATSPCPRRTRAPTSAGTAAARRWAGLRPDGGARRHNVGRRDPRGDRGGAGAHRSRCRHSDPALPAAWRDGILRPGDQQAAQRRRRRTALGPRRRPRRLPGFAELKRSLRERPQLASSASTPNRSASKRTGTAAAVARIGL